MSVRLARETMAHVCAMLGFPIPVVAVDFTRARSVGGTFAAYNHGSAPFHVRGSADVSIGSANGRRVVTTNTGFTTVNRLTIDSSLTASKAVVGPKLNVTMVCVVTPLRKSSGRDVIAIGSWNSGAAPGTNSFCIGLNYATGPTDYKTWFGIEIGSTSYIALNPSAWTTGARQVIIGVRDSTSMKLFINGALVATATPSTGLVNVPTYNIQIAELGQGPAFHVNGHYESVMIFHHALDDQQVARLSARPDLLFAKDDVEFGSPRMSITPVVGSGTASLGFFGT